MGEIYDKLSILQLKLEYIQSEEKRKEIEREIKEFQSLTLPPEYDLLMYVNREIWRLTDIIKSISPNNNMYGKVAFDIIDRNQQRFRIKNMINNHFEGSLKEQKSYKNSHAVLVVTDFWKAVPIARYLLTLYDTLSFEGDTKDIQALFPSSVGTPEQRYIDTDVQVPDMFKYAPISYISGGLLGDFIHQLSVVYEKSMMTGRKARLYISETVGDKFRLGIEYTYKDIFPVISKLPYIESFELYKGQQVDINLSSWRDDSNLYSKSWQQIFSIYGVRWGSHPWIYNCTIKPEFENIIFMSTSSTRFNSEINWKEFIDNHPYPVVFLDNQNTTNYNHFTSTTGINIPCYVAVDFSDLVNCIYSCKKFIGTLSMPLAVADAMKKDRIAIVVPGHMDTPVAIKTNSSYYPL